MSPKVPVNLASEPFQKTRPMLVASAVAALLLVGLLALLVGISVSERGQAAQLRQTLARLERERRTLDRERARLDAVLRQPENAEVLARSLFLNSLLYAKGISWTRIFSDLEKIVPYNVKISNIRPSVDAQNHVTLNMTVATETTEAYVLLLIALENSPAFGDVTEASRIPPNQSDPLWRIQVTMTYAQNL